MVRTFGNYFIRGAYNVFDIFSRMNTHDMLFQIVLINFYESGSESFIRIVYKYSIDRLWDKSPMAISLVRMSHEAYAELAAYFGRASTLWEQY